MFAKIVGLPIRAASFAGEHNHRTGIDAVEVVKQMAGLYPDGVIASTLNRLGFKTGYGNTWRKHLVCSSRSKLDLPTYERGTRLPPNKLPSGLA